MRIEDSLADKNYLIKISKTSLYMYIVKPLIVKIFCGLEERVANISVTTRVEFTAYCEILEFSRHEFNDSILRVFNDRRF